MDSLEPGFKEVWILCSWVIIVKDLGPEMEYIRRDSLRCNLLFLMYGIVVAEILCTSI